ncbi:MAG: DUF1294 domain-containing protein [Thermoleophilia bacterium]|nr:DUF1294 domain-containing protein [Thermoleophilia bacterium]
MAAVILIVLVVLNAWSFALFGIDKRRAREGGRRISERALIASGAVSGTVGAWAGVRVFRHKTRKPSFLARLALASAADAALVALLILAR